MPFEHIDSWVREGYEEAKKKFPDLHVDNADLGHLSQIHRSGDGSTVFQSDHGIDVGSRDALARLFEKVGDGTFNLGEALKHPRVAHFRARKEQCELD
ncbi:MAG: hypothetical protein AAB588_04685 [Patescibacteria group bacterium]